MARLAPDARRAQLVDVGVDLLRSRSLDQLALEDVAAAAGISRALPFHYFPSRRDFLVAVVEAAARDLLDAIVTDPDLPPVERLAAGLDGYLRYIEQNPAAYIALMRGAAGADASLVAVFDRTREAIVDQILAGLEPEEGPLLRLAVRGWVGMVEEAAVTWLRHDSADRPDHDGPDRPDHDSADRPDPHVPRGDLVWLLEQALIGMAAAISSRQPASHQARAASATGGGTVWPPSNSR